jgi:hypothetical protein
MENEAGKNSGAGVIESGFNRAGRSRFQIKKPQRIKWHEACF